MRAAAANDDMAQLVTHDLQFHHHLCEWSGQIGLLRAWLPYNQIQLFVTQTHEQYFSSLMSMADTHEVIIETLKTGDPDTAEEVIKQHVMLIWSFIQADKADR